MLKTGGEESAKNVLLFQKWLTESFQCLHLRASVYEEKDYFSEFSSTFMDANQNLVLHNLKNPEHMSKRTHLKNVRHKISTSSFFHKSVSLEPLSILLGPFRIFTKIREDV